MLSSYFTQQAKRKKLGIPPLPLNPEETAEVEAISGSFMMVRREIIEQVGFLDERFFMYGEDLDWCYRIWQSKWKIVYFP